MTLKALMITPEMDKLLTTIFDIYLKNVGIQGVSHINYITSFVKDATSFSVAPEAVQPPDNTLIENEQQSLPKE